MARDRVVSAHIQKKNSCTSTSTPWNTHAPISTELNRAYNAVHKTKEDLFWATYMATSDDQAGFTRAENAYKDFISDPAKLQATRDHLAHLQVLPAGAARDALLHGLNGLAGAVRGQHHRQR